MREKMLRLVMSLNIVFLAYCGGFKADKALWYVVYFSEKTFQSPFVVAPCHLASFRIHEVELKNNYDVSSEAQTLKQHANVLLNYDIMTLT